MPKAFILCKVTNIIRHSHRLSTSTFTLTPSLLNPYILWVKIHKEKSDKRKSEWSIYRYRWSAGKHYFSTFWKFLHNINETFVNICELDWCARQEKKPDINRLDKLRKQKSLRLNLGSGNLRVSKFCAILANIG